MSAVLPQAFGPDNLAIGEPAGVNAPRRRVP